MIPLLLTLIPIWSSKEIYSTWTPIDSRYEYILEISTDPEFSNIYLTTIPTKESSTTAVIHHTNKYYQRVKYYIPNTDIFGYIFLGQFYINLEHGYYGEEIIEFPEEEKPVTEQSPVEEINIETKEDTRITPKNFDYRGEIATTPSASVLGVSTENQKVCKISILKDEITKVKSWDCDLNIQISNVKYIDWKRYIYLDIEGTYTKDIKGEVSVYMCKSFSLFDPGTWFKCKEILIDIYVGDISFIYSGNIYLNSKVQQNRNFAFMDTSFLISNIYTEDISKQSIYLEMDMYSQVKGKEWIDISYSIKKDVSLPQLEKAPEPKPFSFPLDMYIGVTQWHGCTVYQCPHKGIDFGATLNTVISVGDGTVTNVGYDRYGGECNQGGNFVIVKHTNGMYSAYIHLDSYKVKVGDVLKKGGYIGVSGNTGMKNCQPLKYHLHFETRLQESSKTHVNPVEYINTNWNSIPTIGYRQFPGRLGGDNPHPSF